MTAISMRRYIAFKHFVRRNDRHIHAVFDIAADLVVNQYITASSLPDNAITINCFPQLNLESGQTLEHYYEVLIKHYVPKDIHDTDSKSGKDQAKQRHNKGLAVLATHQQPVK